MGNAASAQGLPTGGYENGQAALNLTQIARYSAGQYNVDGGVMVYDVTDPAAITFVNYVNTRDFGTTVEGSEQYEDGELDTQKRAGPPQNLQSSKQRKGVRRVSFETACKIIL